MRRIDQARLALEVAQAQFARAAARPTEPIRDGETIVTFDKTFGRNNRHPYSYAAIRVEATGKWYTTILSNRTQWGNAPLSWDELLDFVEYAEEEMPEIWVASAYERVL